MRKGKNALAFALLGLVSSLCLKGMKRIGKILEKRVS